VRTSDIKHAEEIKACFITVTALTTKELNDSTTITLQKMARPNTRVEDQTDAHKPFSWHIITEKVKTKIINYFRMMVAIHYVLLVVLFTARCHTCMPSPLKPIPRRQHSTEMTKLF